MNEGNNIPPMGNIPAIGDGEGEIPLAKQPTEKVDMRTMASDIASMQETGGTMPRPYTPGASPQQSGQKLGTLEEKQPMQSAFVQPTNPPVTQGIPIPDMPQTPAPEAPHKKNIFMWIVGGIVLIGIVAAIYFFVVPMFNAGPSDETTTPEQGVTKTEEIIPTENIPPIETPENTSTLPEAPEKNTQTPLPSGQTLEIHVSFLKNPADLVFDAKLSSFGLADMTGALEFTSTSIPVFKEVVFKTAENKPVSFGYVVSRFFPTFFTPETVAKFQNDGTVFTYTNTKGTWLGVIAKLKDGVAIAPIQDSMATLQKSPDLKNIFIIDPGAQGAWKDGKVANKPTSLVSFAQNGATLSYTWFDRYLLIGTNIDASGEAAKRLGY